MLPTFWRWSTSSRRLGALILLVLLPSAAALVWLGVQLLEQDRRLWADRELERRDAAADIIVRALGQQLVAADGALAAGQLPEGTVLATMTEVEVGVRPRNSVLWLPALPPLTEANAEAFAEGEAAEFRRAGDRGLGTYAALRRSPDPAVQAGALLRIARVHRAAGDIAAAIHDYRDLAQFTQIGVGGMPADLVARRAICELFEQSRESASLVHEANSLRTDFLEGRWALDRSGWTLVADDIERWTGRPLEISPEPRAVTAAVNWLWQREQATDSAAETSTDAGRQVFRHDTVSILVLRRMVGENSAALLVPPAVAARWAREAIPPELIAADSLVLTDDAGTTVSGTKAEGGPRVLTRLAADTGLPWNVALKPAAMPGDSAALTSRRRLLGAGLGAIVLLLSGASYLLWRTIQRELAVARLQTEFVAAVSHEFRTPLTSLQHLTELLSEDDDIPPERRRSMYAALGRSTERLRGLVESLLDFARMEDGRRPYHLQPVDAASLVTVVISEFERNAPIETIAITTDVDPQARLRCRVDAAAFRHALWNLLDNAVKYSPAPHAITVSVRQRGEQISIAVADRGFGIPARERQSVFQKFVRGSDTLRRGISGTGLGLAMVSHIVAAHHGRIELESEEGHGSTFTILLPMSPEA